ncbi:MAG: tyrosine-type recombinase/integrase [Firmicutes bacterium]|nr:tyrosine-type recombinase/integrase [Bacillota bacterium]
MTDDELIKELRSGIFKLSQLFSEYEKQKKPPTHPVQGHRVFRPDGGFDIHLVRNPSFEAAQDTHIDNLIQSSEEQNIDNSSPLFAKSEEEEILRLNKNTRKRKDGRYEWRKTVQGVSHYLINSNLKILVKMVSDYKKTHFRINAKEKIKNKESRKLIDLAWTWYRLHKEGKTKTRMYHTSLNRYLSKLSKNIDTYTKNDIIEFLNSMEKPRMKEHCHIIIKNVFAEATESGLIKRNIIATLKCPRVEKVKGLWYNPDEQKLLYENRHKCHVWNEIEFFLMVGCRLSEAFKCRLELDRLRIWVVRTKQNGTSGYVNISERYAKHLEENWSKMFKHSPDYYTREFVTLINSLGITRQKNEKPIHRLRHTFATNIYYFGVNDKKRSYLLGHKTTEMTNDIYTDFDLDIRQEQIKSIYGDLYPQF